MYEAGEQHLYGGVERLRANIRVSEAAYAEASARVAKGRAGIAVAQAVDVETPKVAACRIVSRLAGKGVRALAGSVRA
jgi:hypothetical protein